MKKIVIAGEIYSTNIGDGVIYQALRGMFNQQVPNCNIMPIDISGRKQITLAQTANLKRNFLQYGERHLGIIYSLANGASQALINHKRRENHWKSVLDGASALIIGGGQLFMDNHLGFPVKLFGLVKTALDMAVPVHISACGVGQPWSLIGRACFKMVFSNAETITLRDSLSQSFLKAQFPEISSEVTMDPAICAHRIYDIPSKKQNSFLIGLGVMNRWDANFHFSKKQRFSKNHWLQIWMGFISELSSRGYEFEIFTTGTPSDDAYAHFLQIMAKDQFGIECPISPRPISTLHLIQTLRRYSGIIAARLHATIIANSYRIPSIGLGWDPKIKSYFRDTEQEENWFDLLNIDQPAVIRRCQEAIHAGMDSFPLSLYQEKAERNIQIILTHLGELD